MSEVVACQLEALQKPPVVCVRRNKPGPISVEVFGSGPDLSDDSCDASSSNYSQQHDVRCVKEER